MLITQEAQEEPTATGQKCDTVVNTQGRGEGKWHLVLRPKRKQDRDLLLTHITLKGLLTLPPRGMSLPLSPVS